MRLLVKIGDSRGTRQRDKRCSEGDRDRWRDVDETRRWRRRREELSWPLAMRRVEPTLTRVPQG